MSRVFYRIFIIVFCIAFLFSVFEITKFFLVRHDEKETMVHLTKIRGAVPEKPTVSSVEPHTERKTEYPTEKKRIFLFLHPKVRNKILFSTSKTTEVCRIFLK